MSQKQFERNLEKSFTDVISTELFLDPVVADDGMVYEKDMIEAYFDNIYAPKSPITREYMTSDVCEIPLYKELVDEFIAIHPEYKKIRYERDYTYLGNLEKIWNIVLNPDQHNELLKYSEYDMYHKKEGRQVCFVNLFFKHCADKKIAQHVLSNSINSNKPSDNNWYPIHYICARGDLSTLLNYIACVNSESIKKITDCGNNALHIACKHNNNFPVAQYLLENHFSADVPGEDNLLPFQLLLHAVAYNYSIIEYFIMNGKYFDYDMGSGMRPIHYICMFCEKIDIYKKLSAQGINFNAKTSDGATPFHILSKHCSDVDILKYFVNVVKVDVELEDNDGWRPMHYACRHNTFSVINYFTTIGTMAHAQIKKFNGNDACYTPAALIQINDNLNEHDVDLLTQLFICLCMT